MTSYDYLAQRAAEAVHSIGKGWHVDGHLPATSTDLDRCEALIGARLPVTYRTFLSRSNGMILGIQRRPAVRYELTLLNTDEIIERTLEHRDYAQQSFPEESFEGLIVFADTMDGDICLFDASREHDGTVPVLGGNREDDPDGWRDTVIAADFDQWYRNVLTYVAEFGDHDDFRYWWVPDWTLKP